MAEGRQAIESSPWDSVLPSGTQALHSARPLLPDHHVAHKVVKAGLRDTDNVYQASRAAQVLNAALRCAEARRTGTRDRKPQKATSARQAGADSTRDGNQRASL